MGMNMAKMQDMEEAEMLRSPKGKVVYIPYGEEWRAAMKKHTKEEILDLIVEWNLAPDFNQARIYQLQRELADLKSAILGGRT